MPIYRQSADSEIIYVRVPVTTATTIQAYGSDDGYSAPGTEFGSDETIMIAGTVTATDGADLTAGSIEIRLNGGSIANVGLSYDPGLGVNYYQYTLGSLAEGDYTIEARFRRLRM